ncbi:ribosome modulation factor [Methylobacterium mesophilicum]
MDTRLPLMCQPIAEGAHARAMGRSRDSCPYRIDAPERQAWLDGYDGTPSEDGPDVPISDAS